jgi:hypothetical protein
VNLGDRSNKTLQDIQKKTNPRFLISSPSTAHHTEAFSGAARGVSLSATAGSILSRVVIPRGSLGNSGARSEKQCL